jgi:hypothetical protein
VTKSETMGVMPKRALKLLAGFALGGTLAVAAFFVFLSATDIGYHRLTVQNDTDTTIVLSMGVAPFSPSHSTIPAHSSRTVNGSRFQTPSEVLFLEQPQGRVCSMSWRDAMSSQPLVIRTLGDVCCPPPPDVICSTGEPLVIPL